MFLPFNEPLSTVMLIVTAGFFGLCLGSFYNVIIYRLPIILSCSPDNKQLLTLSFPASHCSTCQTPLGIRDNIPICSYLWLKGHCRYCHSSISYWYPLIELMTATVFVLLTFFLKNQLFLLVGMLIFSSFLLILSAIDWQQMLLPDRLTFPLLWLGLLFNLGPGLVELPIAVLGVVVGYLFFYLVAKITYFIKKEAGLGLGDAKLLAALAAWLGVYAIIPLVFLAVVLVLMMMLLYWLTQQKKITRFPFGPSLALAGFLLALYQSHHNLPVTWDFFL